jgi:hypothetical protein
MVANPPTDPRLAANHFDFGIFILSDLKSLHIRMTIPVITKAASRRLKVASEMFLPTIVANRMPMIAKGKSLRMCFH